MTGLEETFDDVVIGGGAVGLWAALTLADAGRSVCLVDAAPVRKGNTYSVPLHPSTTERLVERGLFGGLEGSRLAVDSFTCDGLTWRCDGSPVGAHLRFVRGGTDASRLWVVALDRLEAAIEQGAVAAGVCVRRGMRVERLEDGPDSVQLDLVDATSGAASRLQATLVIGADGCHSSTRAAAGIDYVEMGPPETYLVFEGPAPESGPEGLEVMLHDGMASSVWPLAGGRWRGNLRVPAGEEDGIDAAAPATREILTRWLAERSGGKYAAAGEVDWLAKAPFELRLVDTFCRGRVCIAGDAAHSAGPTAAHSMNRGFDEVEELIAAHEVGADAVAAVEAGIRSEWEWVFGIGAPVVPATLANAVEAGWPVNWVDTIPASGAQLEGLLDEGLLDGGKAG